MVTGNKRLNVPSKGRCIRQRFCLNYTATIADRDITVLLVTLNTGTKRLLKNNMAAQCITMMLFITHCMGGFSPSDGQCRHGDSTKHLGGRGRNPEIALTI
jgi:hypothetical protein